MNLIFTQVTPATGRRVRHISGSASYRTHLPEKAAFSVTGW